MSDVNECKEFLIIDYTDVKVHGIGNPVLRRVYGLEELLRELSAAKKGNDVQIAVYEIGNCLLDWS